MKECRQEDLFQLIVRFLKERLCRNPPILSFIGRGQCLSPRTTLWVLLKFTLTFGHGEHSLSPPLRIVIAMHYLFQIYPYWGWLLCQNGITDLRKFQEKEFSNYATAAGVKPPGAL
jgi:hypothetical protein